MSMLVQEIIDFLLYSRLDARQKNDSSRGFGYIVLGFKFFVTVTSDAIG
jgi:hypothetical protein